MDMKTHLENVGRLIRQKFEELHEQAVKVQLTEIFKIEKLDLDLENPDHEKEIIQFIDNNGKYQFINIERGPLEVHVIVLEIGTDRFVLGHIIKVDFFHGGTNISMSEMKPKIDPVEFGRKIRKHIGPEKPKDPTVLH